MSKQFTLGKEERLKSRKQTELLFSGGKKFVSGSLRVYYLYNAAEKTQLLFGVGVSTKLFKKAASRNRVKRMIRETYRLQKKELRDIVEVTGKSVHVFFIYTGKDLPVYEELFQQTGKALEKLCKIMAG